MTAVGNERRGAARSDRADKEERTREEGKYEMHERTNGTAITNQPHAGSVAE